jgi:hypothetical protein
VIATRALSPWRRGIPATAFALLGVFGSLVLDGCSSSNAIVANPSSVAYAASTCSGGVVTQHPSGFSDSAAIGVAPLASPSAVAIPPPVEFDVAATRLIENTVNNAIQGVTVNAEPVAPSQGQSQSPGVVVIRVAFVSSSGSYPYSAADFSYRDSTGKLFQPFAADDARLAGFGPILGTGTLGANQEVRGSLAFGAAAGAGTLRYEPRYSGCPAVSWTLNTP